MKLLIIITALLGLSLVGCSQQQDFPKAQSDVVDSIRVSLDSGASSEAADAPADSGSDPTGFVALRGTFKLDGAKPALKKLNISKDPTVCAPGGKDVFSQDIIVDDATNGIANILIYVDNRKMPEGWIHADAKPGAKSDAVIFDQKECVFLTRVVAIQTSQHLRVLNSDPVGHNLKVGAMNETIAANKETTYQPTSQERSPISMECSVHPWMKAWFISRDNGYFAVTAEDGSFEIPNLPAGVPLEFKVWHERIGAVQDVSVDGAATKWSKGKLKLTLDASGDKTMNVAINSSTIK